MITNRADKLFALQQASRKQLLLKGDYLAYLKYVHQGNYQIAPHNTLIAHKLEEVEKGNIKKIMFFLPPRHSKSMTITESFPAYFMLRNPEKRVIEVSYSGDFAEAFGRRNREKLRMCGAMFGCELDPENRKACDFSIKDHRGGMLSAGIDGQITGKGADLLIVDDPIKNHKEAFSSTMRDKLWNEYLESCNTRLQPGAAIIIVMTRWHSDDLAARIFEHDPSFEVVNLPAICDDPATDLLHRKNGEPLWDQYGFDLEFLNEKKALLGEKRFNSLYQGKPTIDGGNMFKYDWWKFYTPTTLPEPKSRQWYQSWDFSVKSKKQAKSGEPDYVAGLIGYKEKARFYLIAVFHKQIGFVETLKTVRDYQAKYPGCRTLIEDKANGSPIIDVIDDEIPGIIKIEPEGTKEERAIAATTWVEAGNVYLPEKAEWLDTFTTEFTEFPGGKNDDQVDALSQLLNDIYNNTMPGISSFDIF